MRGTNPIWTLDEALTLTRRLSLGCTQAGYFVSLAGGVLQNGVSYNDLNLLIVSRTDVTQNSDRLLWLLRQTFSPRSKTKFLADRTLLHVYFKDKPVDITILT